MYEYCMYLYLSKEYLSNVIRNYRLLSKEEVAALILLCIALNPPSLEGKIFFLTPDLEKLGHFIRITDARVVVASHTIDLPDQAVNGIFLGAKKEIHDIMLYKREWIEQNYIQPLKNLSMHAL